VTPHPDSEELPEPTALSSRRLPAPVEQTAPSRREQPGERTVRSVDTSGDRPRPVIPPAPAAAGASRAARAPQAEDAYTPRADTAARVARTTPDLRAPQPVVDVAAAAPGRRRRARARALIAALAALVGLAAIVGGLVAVLVVPV
jgi:hypothetical protein